MAFTVTLSLPDLCDPGDWQDEEPTPVDAVEAFQNALGYSDHLYAYRVVDEHTGKTYLVDMSDGSVREQETS